MQQQYIQNLKTQRNFQERYYIQKNGQQFGPYEKSLVIEYHRTGQISDDDLIIQEGSPSWTRVRDLFPNSVLVTTLGFHPKVAAFTVIIDLVVFGGTVVFFPGWIFLVFLALALGFIAYNGQKNWYGDNNSDALTKAVMVAVLTGIPLPIATALMAYSKLIKGGIRERK